MRRWLAATAVGALALVSLACAGLGAEMMTTLQCGGIDEALVSLPPADQARLQPHADACRTLAAEKKGQPDRMTRMVVRAAADGKVSQAEVAALEADLQWSRRIDWSCNGRMAEDGSPYHPPAAMVRFIEPPRADDCGNVFVTIESAAKSEGARLSVGIGAGNAQLETCVPEGLTRTELRLHTVEAGSTPVWVESGDPAVPVRVEEYVDIIQPELALARDAQLVSATLSAEDCLPGQLLIEASYQGQRWTRWPIEAGVAETFSAPSGGLGSVSLHHTNGGQVHTYTISDDALPPLGQ